MILNKLVDRPCPWLSVEQETGIVVSSRIRLARNVKGRAFPGWAGEAESELLCREVIDACGKVACLSESAVVDTDELSDIEREFLKERRLISNEFGGKRRGSSLVLAQGDKVAIMINEEDHLRLQAIGAGMCLDEAWNILDMVDSKLEEHLTYAYSPTLGYLTACPTNVGTGLRASVMVHLAGLRMTGEFDQVMKGLTRLGLAVRGIFGEGTEPCGGMVQISNQSTLGESETAIIARLSGIIDELIGHEKNARARVVEKMKIMVLDQISRALAIARHSRLLSSGECIELLLTLRLGVALHLLGGITENVLNELLLFTQPAHLQIRVGRGLEPIERDRVRAEMVREHLKEAEMAE